MGEKNLANLEALKNVYTHTPFSVFSVNQQVKKEKSEYTTIHSAFIIPVSGSAQITLNGESFICKDHTIVHGCPDKTLLFEPLGKIPFSHINIYYDSSSTSTSIMRKPFCFIPQKFSDILTQAQRLENLNLHPSLDNRLSQIVGATELIKSMFSQSPKDTLTAMTKVRSYLEVHFADSLTISSLAKSAGLSTRQFSDEFYRAFGIRPMNFIISKRLSHANQLLQSGYSVHQVAETVGYKDPFYFSRLFKKYMGYPPRDIKQCNA